MFVFLCLSHFTYCDNLQVCPCCYKGFPDDSHSKISVYNRGDSDLSTGSGRSPGEGKGYPLQYSCLKNPMDRGARHVVIESHTTELLTLSCCYKWRYCILFYGWVIFLCVCVCVCVYVYVCVPHIYSFIYWWILKLLPDKLKCLSFFFAFFVFLLTLINLSIVKLFLIFTVIN